MKVNLNIILNYLKFITKINGNKMGICFSNRKKNKNDNMGAPSPIISSSLPEKREIETAINNKEEKKKKKELPELESINTKKKKI